MRRTGLAAEHRRAGSSATSALAARSAEQAGQRRRRRRSRGRRRSFSGAVPASTRKPGIPVALRGRPAHSVLIGVLVRLRGPTAPKVFSSLRFLGVLALRPSQGLRPPGVSGPPGTLPGEPPSATRPRGLLRLRHPVAGEPLRVRPRGLRMTLLSRRSAYRCDHQDLVDDGRYLLEWCPRKRLHRRR